MRLTDLVDRDQAFKHTISFVLAVLFLVAVAVPSQSLSRFYLALDQLSDSVRRSDFDQAAIDISEITAFYESSRSWRLQSVADSYLFRDAFLQQASYSYLVGDYEAVMNDLEDRVDDPRASYLLANAKFQLARTRYRSIQADAPNAEAMQRAVIENVLDDINADYERALRGDVDDRFEYKWNYDLTSDEDAIREALESPQVIQFPELEQLSGEGTPVRRRRG